MKKLNFPNEHVVDKVGPHVQTSDSIGAVGVRSSVVDGTMSDLTSKAAAQKGSTASRYRGVRRTRAGRWQAQITHDGQIIVIGRFDEEMEAARAYDRRALELKGRKAILNFSLRELGGEGMLVPADRAADECDGAGDGAQQGVGPSVAEGEQNSFATKLGRRVSKYRGVHPRGLYRWQAGVKVQGKYHSLGSFRDEEAAARAYDAAALINNGDHAILNFPSNKFGHQCRRPGFKAGASIVGLSEAGLETGEDIGSGDAEPHGNVGTGSQSKSVPPQMAAEVPTEHLKTAASRSSAIVSATHIAVATEDASCTDNAKRISQDAIATAEVGRLQATTSIKATEGRNASKGKEESKDQEEAGPLLADSSRGAPPRGVTARQRKTPVDLLGRPKIWDEEAYMWRIVPVSTHGRWTTPESMPPSMRDRSGGVGAGAAIGAINQSRLCASDRGGTSALGSSLPDTGADGSPPHPPAQWSSSDVWRSSGVGVSSKTVRRLRQVLGREPLGLELRWALLSKAAVARECTTAGAAAQVEEADRESPPEPEPFRWGVGEDEMGDGKEQFLATDVLENKTDGESGWEDEWVLAEVIGSDHHTGRASADVIDDEAEGLDGAIGEARIESGAAHVLPVCGQRFSRAEDAFLIQGRAAGRSWVELGRQMRRTPDACRRRLVRLAQTKPELARVDPAHWEEGPALSRVELHEQRRAEKKRKRNRFRGQLAALGARPDDPKLQLWKQLWNSHRAGARKLLRDTAEALSAWEGGKALVARMEADLATVLAPADEVAQSIVNLIATCKAQTGIIICGACPGCRERDCFRIAPTPMYASHRAKACVLHIAAKRARQQAAMSGRNTEGEASTSVGENAAN